MLPIGFAALLGLVLGRYFRVAVLAPGVVATTIFAAFVDWPNGAGASATLAAVVIAAVSLSSAISSEPRPHIRALVRVRSIRRRWRSSKSQPTSEIPAGRQ